jgi:dolichyl-phosphate beta-glucosyltransferase
VTKPFLSVIIPAYNEAERIGPTLERVLAWGECLGQVFDIIVVDDGSSDGTVEIASQFGLPVRVLKNGSNRGKGYSVRHGVLDSRGTYVLFSDADLSTPIEDYDRLFAAITAGNDIAVGSRALKDSNVTRHQPYYREAMGRTFNRIVRGLAVPGIMDTQCGFKLFKGEAARELFAALTTEGFAFDVEVLFVAIRRGFRIAEVPVTWANDERSSVHAVFDSVRMLRDVVRLRIRHSRWIPGRPA